MKGRSRVAAAVVVGLCLSSGAGLVAYTQVQSPAPATIKKEGIMTSRASGTFEVKLSPQTPSDPTDATRGRFSIDKQFHGDIEGVSKGEMLTAGTPVEGSAGYVAIERITGTLRGRTGSFVLQHNGTMTRGAPQLSVTVVPDSGSGQLKGLTGRMTIDIGGGKHAYDFEYAISDAP